MKKVITGASILLTGALIVLSVFIAGSNVATIYTSWHTQSGRFWSAISEANLYPVLFTGIMAMVLGLGILAWGNFDKSNNA
ncbi:MAG: hypothetical protein FWC07_08355 [Defluviitaleaceae bacterium]|nr:hypothetical protein [Defluviitaleaceae bacterium]